MSKDYLMGFWHKAKIRCDKCGIPNPKGLTFVVNSPEISGKFCGDIHAKEAWEEMKQAKGEEK